MKKKNLKKIVKLPIVARTRASRVFREFLASEQAGGLLLIVATVLSLYIANSSSGAGYIQMWQTSFAGMTIQHWINDALMAVFFLLVGLELEREFYVGELSNLQQAILPFAAAIGGMVVPAGLYTLWIYTAEVENPSSLLRGVGIPTATDIAFALGVLSLVGNRVPVSAKVFLTALAVIDDLGAILVIAIFYSTGIVWIYLLGALGIFSGLLLLNKLGIRRLWIYLTGGVGLWICMHNSGIHATIAGVLTAFAIPFDNDNKNNISLRLQLWLHKPVAFFILPLFAFANTAIVIEQNWLGDIASAGSIAIILGLALGKPIGITLFSWIAVSLRLASLPVTWRILITTSIFGGIGFTMSIFITLLAFNNEILINQAKIAILVASFLTGGFGFLLYQCIDPVAYDDKVIVED